MQSLPIAKIVYLMLFIHFRKTANYQNLIILYYQSLDKLAMDKQNYQILIILVIHR